MKHKFIYNKDSHISEYILKARNKTFSGIVECHPDDYDFETEFVGHELAYIKAITAEQQDYVQMLKEQHKILSHVNDIFANNPAKYNLDGAEVKLVRKQIKIIDEKIFETERMIDLARKAYKGLVDSKDRTYRRIKKNREYNNGNIAKSNSNDSECAKNSANDMLES